MPAGYVWTLCEEQGFWRWTVLKRDDQEAVDSGVASSRPEGAACLVRAIARLTLVAETKLTSDAEIAA